MGAHKDEYEHILTLLYSCELPDNLLMFVASSKAKQREFNWCWPPNQTDKTLPNIRTIFFLPAR